MKRTEADLRRAMRLYAVTDRTWLKPGEDLADVCRRVLEGGATFLQVREKEMMAADFAREAARLQALCREYGVPMVVNDSVEIALEIGADGVHVGQSDIQGRDIRAMLGPDKILGISARTVEEAAAAQQAGADYLGVGAVFGTSTKKNALTLSVEQLREIAAAVTIPVVAIGGVQAHNLPLLTASGAAGAAVVSAIFAADDPGAAAAHLRQLADEAFGHE